MSGSPKYSQAQANAARKAREARARAEGQAINYVAFSGCVGLSVGWAVTL